MPTLTPRSKLCAATLFSLVAAGCARAPAALPQAAPPSIASHLQGSRPQSEPVASPNEAATLSSAQNAAVLLERALDALRDDQPAFAAAALRAALATADLNEAGRALAYWYIYVAEEMQGHRRGSVDALADFVAVGAIVLSARDTLRTADSGGSDFVDRFDLVGRLARSRALLNLAWAQAHSDFGRSAASPVPVQSAAEMDYFIELLPHCARALPGRSTEHHVLRGGSMPLQQVNFRCASEERASSYFFEYHAAADR